MLRELGTTGLMVNPIGFGGIPIQRLSMEESDRVIEEAIASGINFFDSSRIYSDSEEKLGRIFCQYRDRVIIATKSFACERDMVLRDIETSLKKLKTDNIEIYQCHNISSIDILDKALGKGGAIEGLMKAKEEGLIGHIGITGHKPWIMVEALKRFDFETIQVPFNYIETSSLEELIPLAKEKEVGIIAMKPVAGGAIKNTDLNFRFILNCGIDVVIPGMDRIGQVKKNLSVLKDLSPLTKGEIKVLEEEKEILGETFCRRCEYCMPCPQGLNIPFLHLLGAYYFRYELKQWAWKRLTSLPKGYQNCIDCKECIEKCPYDLDMPNIFRDLNKRIREDYKTLKKE